MIFGRGLRMGAVEDCNRVGEGDGTLTSKARQRGVTRHAWRDGELALFSGLQGRP